MSGRNPPVFWRVLASLGMVVWASSLWLLHPGDPSPRSLSLVVSDPAAAPTVREVVPPPRPENDDYNFTVAICAAAKDAEAYLEEWLDFHLVGMGFQNIYLYDNSDAFDLRAWHEHTRDHPVYSRVEVVHYPGNSWIEEEEAYVQNLIVSDCIRRFGVDEHGPQHDYIALFDLDEFLVPQSPRYGDVRAILREYLVPYGGALTINWMLFGTANHTLYAPIPVTKRFQYRDAEPHYVVKSIVKSTDFRGLRNPHAVRLRTNTTVRTTKCPGCIQDDPTSKTGASDHDRPSGVALLYHYRYTSTKEYLWKRCVRGNLSAKHMWCNRGTLRTHNTPSHIQPRPGTVYDDTAWRFLTSRVPRYRAFEDWEDLT